MLAVEKAYHSNLGATKMRALRLKNIRSLADTHSLKIRPITLLIGQNSSGKSTFLRTFPLLEQSVRTRSNTPILWYGDLVDFGTIEDVKSTFAKRGAVAIEIELGPIDLFMRTAFGEKSSELFNVALQIQLAEIDGRTALCGFQIGVGRDRLRVSLTTNGAVSALSINSRDYTRLFPRDRYRFGTTTLVPIIQSRFRTSDERSVIQGYGYRSSLGPSSKEIIQMFRSQIHGRLSPETLTEIAHAIRFTSATKFPNALRSASSLKSWTNYVDELLSEKKSDEFKKLRDLYFLSRLDEMLFSLERQTTRIINNISYVGPSRATSERYYRIQELAVDRIDPQGRNLAMFLHSLPAMQQRRFSSWLEDAIGYSIKVEKSAGHIQLLLSPSGEDVFHNMSDMGYGFSQVLPILAQVWSRESRQRISPVRGGPSTVAMEQPELHLHPAYQAKLADVLARAVRSRSSKRQPSTDLRFIVETHSEAIVNRIGDLVYRGELAPADVGIYIFEKSPDEKKTSIREAHFDHKGALHNWPLGFFSANAI